MSWARDISSSGSRSSVSRRNSRSSPDRDTRLASEAGWRRSSWRLVTDDHTIAERLRLSRDYGQRAKYHHSVMGTNSRLDSIQASFLAVKLPHLDRWNEARRHHAARYTELLSGHVQTPVATPHVE